MSKKQIAVLVTTEHRGVFFGYIDPAKKADRVLTLTTCRNCIYWHQSVGGFLGLAGDGPNAECRIGRPADEVTLHDVTSVSLVSQKAEQAWLEA